MENQSSTKKDSSMSRASIHSLESGIYLQKGSLYKIWMSVWFLFKYISGFLFSRRKQILHSSDSLVLNECCIAIYHLKYTPMTYFCHIDIVPCSTGYVVYWFSCQHCSPCCLVSILLSGLLVNHVDMLPFSPLLFILHLRMCCICLVCFLPDNNK